MRNPLLVALALVVLASFSRPARADFDMEGTFLLGSGVDTGGEPHNPYALQFGGEFELIISGFVGGVRLTRAMSSGDVPKELDLRAFGGDLGYEWEIAIVHLGPRVALGAISTSDRDFRSFYLEPGGVAEVELGIFVVGADVRYRVVTEDSKRNGLLVYAKMGLRF